MTPHALIAPARLAGAPLLRAQSDERLVDLVRAGNDAAFEAIVARYRRPLLRYCSGFMSEARAEDAVQTAFVSAYASLRASEGEMNLRPWLYRIAHNTSLNALRDRGLQHEELSEHIDGVERPDQAYEKRERLRDTVAAVSALPDRQRDAMVLRELEGRSYEEIATELGVSDGSVRQLLNRARHTLRAGMTAVTPYGLLARVPWGAGPGESVTARVAEMCAGGAGAAVLTKVCATAVVTGAVVGGVATSPNGGLEDSRARSEVPAQVAVERDRSGADAGVGGAPSGAPDDEGDEQPPGSGGPDDARGAREDRDDDVRRERGPGDDRHRFDERHGHDDDGGRGRGPAGDHDGHRGDRSGPGPGGDDRDRAGGGEDRSGPGGGGDRSGPGSGEPAPPTDRYSSGSGSGGDSSGPGDGDLVPVPEAPELEHNSGPGSGAFADPE